MPGKSFTKFPLDDFDRRSDHYRRFAVQGAWDLRREIRRPGACDREYDDDQIAALLDWDRGVGRFPDDELDDERWANLCRAAERHDAKARKQQERIASAKVQAEPHKIHVTFFENFAASKLTTESVTLEQLRERVLQASRRKKNDLPWLKLAVFGNKRTDKNSLRHDPNVLEITGIELDYDGEKSIAFDNALKVLGEMNIHALIYTSPSHTRDAPRYRIIAPTSKPLPPDRRAKLAGRVKRLHEGQARRRRVCCDRELHA